MDEHDGRQDLPVPPPRVLAVQDQTTPEMLDSMQGKVIMLRGVAPIPPLPRMSVVQGETTPELQNGARGNFFWLNGSAASVSFGSGALTVTGPAPELVIPMRILDRGPRTNEGWLVRHVLVPWRALLQRLEREPEFLLQFSGEEFEELMAAAFTEKGFKATLTPRSGDGGKDVIVVGSQPGLGDFRLLVQAKRYKPGLVVDAEKVRAFMNVVDKDAAASKGVMTTTSTFAPGIYKEFAENMPTRLELVDGKQLGRWLNDLTQE